jgi:hypothetical protein
MIQISVLIRKRGYRYYIMHLIWNVSDEQLNFKIDPFKQQLLQFCTVEPKGSTADLQAFRKHNSSINKATSKNLITFNFVLFYALTMCVISAGFIFNVSHQ